MTENKVEKYSMNDKKKRKFHCVRQDWENTESYWYGTGTNPRRLRKLENLIFFPKLIFEQLLKRYTVPGTVRYQYSTSLNTLFRIVGVLIVKFYHIFFLENCFIMSLVLLQYGIIPLQYILTTCVTYTYYSTRNY